MRMRIDAGTGLPHLPDRRVPNELTHVHGTPRACPGVEQLHDPEAPAANSIVPAVTAVVVNDQGGRSGPTRQTGAQVTPRSRSSRSRTADVSCQGARCRLTPATRWAWAARPAWDDSSSEPARSPQARSTSSRFT
jgi:hypothetical protein